MPQARTLFFTEPYQLEIRQHSLPKPGRDELLVETICSGISSGSELLVYRGKFAADLAEARDQVSNRLNFPLSFGYACVGRVGAIGSAVNGRWRDRLVFAFEPHTSGFITTVDRLLEVPDSVEPEAACLLPSVETALNLVQDGAPIVGERVLVLGQGVVGLLTTALLHKFPLESLVTADCHQLRREASVGLGITSSLDPGLTNFTHSARTALGGSADLAFELSSRPETLNEAVSLTGFDGRVVIGSWYGLQRAPIDLGSSFHRSRIRLISSQVSTIAPHLTGRWDKARRFDLAWKLLGQIRPERWITQRYPLEDAALAYELLDRTPQDALQVILHYR